MSLLIENVRVVTPGKADVEFGSIRCVDARICEICHMGTAPTERGGTVPMEF